jgi:hypothetical protein
VQIAESTASISDVPELHILGGKVAFNESSRLNSHAAIWTGISALLNAIATVAGVIDSLFAR